MTFQTGSGFAIALAAFLPQGVISIFGGCCSPNAIARGSSFSTFGFAVRSIRIGLLVPMFSTLIQETIAVPAFVAVFAVTIPLGVALVVSVRRISHRTNEQFRPQVEHFSARVGEMATLMPVTRAHGLESVAADRVVDSARVVQDAGHSLDKLNGRFGARQDGDFNAYKGMASERYHQTSCFQPKGMPLTLSRRLRLFAGQLFVSIVTSRRCQPPIVLAAAVRMPSCPLPLNLLPFCRRTPVSRSGE